MARKLQVIMGCPSTHDLKVLLKSNQLLNCLVMMEHVDRAEKIYGPLLANLKGKTVQKKSETSEIFLPISSLLMVRKTKRNIMNWSRNFPVQRERELRLVDRMISTLKISSSEFRTS